jgi:hypothetical protein
MKEVEEVTETAARKDGVRGAWEREEGSLASFGMTRFS